MLKSTCPVQGFVAHFHSFPSTCMLIHAKITIVGVPETIRVHDQKITVEQVLAYLRHHQVLATPMNCRLQCGYRITKLFYPNFLSMPMQQAILGTIAIGRLQRSIAITSPKTNRSCQAVCPSSGKTASAKEQTPCQEQDLGTAL